MNNIKKVKICQNTIFTEQAHTEVTLSIQIRVVLGSTPCFSWVPGDKFRDSTTFRSAPLPSISLSTHLPHYSMILLSSYWQRRNITKEWQRLCQFRENAANFARLPICRRGQLRTGFATYSQGRYVNKWRKELSEFKRQQKVLPLNSLLCWRKQIRSVFIQNFSDVWSSSELWVSNGLCSHIW
jgi:hypothetical protein